MFSTTATWNCRGSSRIAKNDSSVLASSVSSGGSRVSTEAASGEFIALLNSATGPSNIQKVTKMPTARNDSSLTIDSAATASISPS